jgi:hypothetical protein
MEGVVGADPLVMLGNMGEKLLVLLLVLVLVLPQEEEEEVVGDLLLWRWLWRCRLRWVWRILHHCHLWGRMMGVVVVGEAGQQGKGKNITMTKLAMLPPLVRAILVTRLPKGTTGRPRRNRTTTICQTTSWTLSQWSLWLIQLWHLQGTHTRGV